jgi:hypothetical protein
MGSTLVIELFIPGGLERCDDHVAGRADNGASRPGFLGPPPRRDEPVPIHTTPDVHLVMTVYGRER